MSAAGGWIGDCVLRLGQPMDQGPQGSAVTVREQQCSHPQPPCRMGCLEAGMDLGTPALHPVPTKTSMGLEKMQELYGV